MLHEHKRHCVCCKIIESVAFLLWTFVRMYSIVYNRTTNGSDSITIWICQLLTPNVRMVCISKCFESRSKTSLNSYCIMFSDLSLLYRFVQQIQKDISQLNAEKENKVMKKNEMKEIDKSVHSMWKVSNKPNALKRKRLDETIDVENPRKLLKKIFLGFSIIRVVLYGSVQPFSFKRIRLVRYLPHTEDRFFYIIHFILLHYFALLLRLEFNDVLLDLLYVLM